MSDLHHRLVTMLIDDLGVEDRAAEPGITFDEIDVDSLLLVEFALLIRREFGKELPEGSLTADSTVADVVGMLREA
ncbi:acyl carrier protein [Lentzea sp. NPDC058436]|uniref:acyl carrier protein n=1 Tax=Lentzea sp. NPDC058436 TaxID=3346499 RepID=UPI00364BB639